jgi:hypothetical protein
VRSQPLNDILSHWSKLIENFNTDSEGFYTAVDAALERRKIHDALTRHIQWSEGGILSPNREYFRIEGSGFAFDLCAAPFGTGFFFSWWLTKKRTEWPGLYMIAFVVATSFIYWGTLRAVPYLFHGVPAFSALWVFQVLALNPFVLLAFSLLVLFWLVAMVARGGFRGAEEVMLGIPGVGWVYERWFAPVTFYRLDTAAMFRATVHAAVLEVIEDLTTKKGLRALAPEDRKPLLDRLG